ncbi:MAG TPA: cytidine deaminase [Stellaceae bacterium]|jgi:cytidine deaminase
MTSPPSQPDDLFAAARRARQHAHAPYSGFKVGAAIRAEDGRIHAGANVENAAYPQSQCAEATAIGAMVTAGARRILEVAVVADSPEPISPCGGCRQRLAEFAAPEVKVHLCGPDGAMRRTVTMGDLLPFAFGEGHLASRE